MQQWSWLLPSKYSFLTPVAFHFSSREPGSFLFSLQLYTPLFHHCSNTIISASLLSYCFDSSPYFHSRISSLFFLPLFPFVSLVFFFYSFCFHSFYNLRTICRFNWLKVRSFVLFSDLGFECYESIKISNSWNNRIAVNGMKKSLNHAIICLCTKKNIVPLCMVLGGGGKGLKEKTEYIIGSSFVQEWKLLKWSPDFLTHE